MDSGLENGRDGDGGLINECHKLALLLTSEWNRPDSHVECKYDRHLQENAT